MGTEIGPFAVRRSIWIDAPPENVWQEFETFERMADWFGSGHELLEYEPRGWTCSSSMPPPRTTAKRRWCSTDACSCSTARGADLRAGVARAGLERARAASRCASRRSTAARWSSCSTTASSVWRTTPASCSAGSRKGGRCASSRCCSLVSRSRDVFGALADPTCRAILERLLDRHEMSAGVARGGVRGHQPARGVQALGRAARGRSRARREDGREVFYALDPVPLATAYEEWWARFAPLWDERLARLKRNVERAPTAAPGGVRKR